MPGRCERFSISAHAEHRLWLGALPSAIAEDGDQLLRRVLVAGRLPVYRVDIVAPQLVEGARRKKGGRGQRCFRHQQRAAHRANPLAGDVVNPHNAIGGGVTFADRNLPGIGVPGEGAGTTRDLDAFRQFDAPFEEVDGAVGTEPGEESAIGAELQRGGTGDPCLDFFDDGSIILESVGLAADGAGDEAIAARMECRPRITLIEMKSGCFFDLSVRGQGNHSGQTKQRALRSPDKKMGAGGRLGEERGSRGGVGLPDAQLDAVASDQGAVGGMPIHGDKGCRAGFGQLMAFRAIGPDQPQPGIGAAQG